MNRGCFCGNATIIAFPKPTLCGIIFHRGTVYTKLYSKLEERQYGTL